MNRNIYIGVGVVVVLVITLTLSFLSDALRIVKGTPKGDVNGGNYYDKVVTHRGVRMMVQPKDIVKTGRTAEDVPPLTDPKFVSIDEAVEQKFLHTDLYGLQLFDGENYRFYPLEILAWHELVFDQIGETPIVVTYAPLTDSFAVFENTSELDLAYSGFVFNNNSLLLDRASNTLYSQLLGKGVYGVNTGSALTTYPSSIIQWETFAQSHPDGQVISSQTGYDFSYELSPYGTYLVSKSIPFPLAHESWSARLAKDGLFGVFHDGGAKAFDVVAIISESNGVKNDVFGNRAFVVWVDKFGALHVNERGDERFVRAEKAALVDEEGNRWEFDSMTQSLTFDKNVRRDVPAIRIFWFAWASTFPQTEIYGRTRKQGFVDGTFVGEISPVDEGVRIEVDEAAIEGGAAIVDFEANEANE